MTSMALHQRILPIPEDMVTDRDLDTFLVMRNSGKFEWELGEYHEVRLQGIDRWLAKPVGERGKMP